MLLYNIYNIRIKKKKLQIDILDYKTIDLRSCRKLEKKNTKIKFNKNSQDMNIDTCKFSKSSPLFFPL